MYEHKLTVPADADARDALATVIRDADALLRQVIRSNTRRQIDAAEWSEAAEIVQSKPAGLHFLCGGTKASEYPATTSVALLSWYTRLNGDKVVRAAIGKANLYSESQNVMRECIGESLMELQDAAGPLFASTFLREVWEFTDVATGSEIDPLAQAVRNAPADMSAWQAYADALRFEDNAKSPAAPETISEQILRRIS